MGEKSWAQIKTEIREELWPFPTEAKTQIKVHDKYFLQGVMEMQKYVPCLQANNTSVFDFCATYYQCGKTIVPAPNFGLIRRVYTVANKKWCDKVFYRSTVFDRIECWTKSLLLPTDPVNAGLSILPMGAKFAEASTNSDCRGGRARSGLWALYRHRLYLAPWIQSNESVCIEWDGMKSDWQDTDMVDDTLWTARVLGVLRDYVWWQHNFRFGDDMQATQMAKAKYDTSLADIIHDCREATQPLAPSECRPSESLVSAAELDDDKVSTDETPYVMATVGDWGNSTSGSDASSSDDAGTSSVSARDAVAALIASWSPSKFIGLGDAWYGTDLTLADLLDRTPAYYQTLNEAGNLVFVIGNHDRYPVGRLDVVKSLFKFPTRQGADADVPNANYFSVVPDPRVEIFVIDAGYDSVQVNQEEDGVTVDSKQARWLRAALARSVAKWKLVFFHQPPFSSYRSTTIGPTVSSDGFLQYPELRWPFKSWGVDAVFNGHIHNYERLEKDGLPYIVVGSGGRAFETFDEAHLSPYSKVRFNGYGAEKITVTCNKLTLEFFDEDTTLKDTLELTK